MIPVMFRRCATIALPAATQAAGRGAPVATARKALTTTTT